MIAIEADGNIVGKACRTLIAGAADSRQMKASESSHQARRSHLYEALILKVQQARHGHAAGVVVGSGLPALLQPPPKHVPPLQHRMHTSQLSGVKGDAMPLATRELQVGLQSSVLVSQANFDDLSAPIPFRCGTSKPK